MSQGPGAARRCDHYSVPDTGLGHEVELMPCLPSRCPETGKTQTAAGGGLEEEGPRNLLLVWWGGCLEEVVSELGLWA